MRRTALAAALTLALTGLAACGSDEANETDDTLAPEAAAETAEPPSEPSDADTFPVSVASGDGEITLESEPQAIVSLSPTATEMLFAVGGGDQVIAVDDQSDFPDGVPVTDLSGFQPNVEAVLGYSPDLVVASDDTNDLVAGLDAAGVPTLLLPAATTIEDTYAQIETVGAATGHVGDAAELVAEMQSDIEAILADVPEYDEPLTYFHELDPTYFSVTSATFIGDVYSRFGLQNIADGAGDPAGDPYPQLSEEFIVTADPQVIFLADSQCCGVTPDQVAQRPGWAGITAVAEGRVVAVDEDTASRWGPRVVDFMADVAAALPAEQPVG